MKIMTTIKITKEEVYKMVHKLLKETHKIDIEHLGIITSNGNFNGFECKAKPINTPLVSEDGKKESDKVMI